MDISSTLPSPAWRVLEQESTPRKEPILHQTPAHKGAKRRLSMHAVVSAPLDPFDRMQSLCCEIALTTMGTADDRDILDNRQAVSFAITPRYMSNSCPFSSANITYHGCSPHLAIQHTPLLHDQVVNHCLKTAMLDVLEVDDTVRIPFSTGGGMP